MNNKIIFDLDGTLIDSKNEILDTYFKVFNLIKPTKKNFKIEDINFSSSLNAILADLFENDQTLISKAKFLFTEIYDSSNFERTNLYDDVFNCLEDFFNCGYDLYIATNKRISPTRKILEAKNILHFFKEVITLDSIENKTLSKTEMVKYLCIRNQIKSGFMVGDSSGDIIAGKEANLDQIAVLYGYEEKTFLVGKKPTFVVNNFKEIQSIIKNYGKY